MSRYIGPPAGSTPSAASDPLAGPRSLPQDLLREASTRLGVIALLGAVLWITGPMLEHVALWAINPANPRWKHVGLPDQIAVLSSAVSLALYAYVRRSTRSPQFLLNLGQAFLIFTAFSIGMIWHIDESMMAHEILPMFTWIGIVVVMFAAILPASPRRTFLTGILAVSMNPLGMLISRARGTMEFGSWGNVILMHYPDYILVGVATVISHVVARLGQQVSKAREMGSYHVGELIGKGGMGEVYRATHRMLHRPAAIKLIRPEMVAGGDSEAARLAVARFRREAEVAASLRSPHTVALYDFGTTDDGALYFVMELLEGLDVELLVRRHGPLPPSRVVHLLRQVCESLEEAHTLGLVHRDIKPANIHVGRVGVRCDFVKVLDFGLVKSIRPDGRGAGRDAGESGERSLATATGLAPGTPDYMAPEMTLGDPVDGRADLYAVGCVAYFMLTGRPVFEASNVFHMIARHLNDEPVPPSDLTAGPVPAELEALVLRCLRKRPDDRPRTAADLATALEQLPVEEWSEAEATRWWIAHPLAANA